MSLMKNRLSDALPRPKRGGDVDMTPMVDVTFLLLIFFMVTASFGLQKSIAMPRQTSPDPGQVVLVEPLPTIEVQVDQYGSFLVLSPAWQKEAIGKQQLTGVLRMAAQDDRAPSLAQLKIAVHEDAKLEALVDAMDAGTTAGFAEIQVTQVDGF